LLPAHLDLLVQTSPRPALEPDVHLYLHGMENGSPEVQVVWRGDLDENQPKQWAEIVSLCPPVSAEAMAVPLRDFRAWLAGEKDEGLSSDIEGIDAEPEAAEKDEGRCAVLRWRGDESLLVGDAGEIRPGDTLVLATSSGGWDELGHIPKERDKDVAERARAALRRGWILRLHPALLKEWPAHAARERLVRLAGEQAPELEAVLEALREYKEAAPEWLVQMLDAQPKRLELDAYPSDGETASVGWVLSGRFAEADSGGDESSGASPVFLDKHLEDVAAAVRRVASALVTNEGTGQSLQRAAERHDWGKVDAVGTQWIA
ncbi:MAG: hypothetical protein NTY38_32790, partial [Acidobacteria bacterium]|nr:hypothetical protein [Acidobacteriota bacterium]